ncbi:MAG TPA: hypothetical protein VH275_04985 [Solirubrobacterales bacterium]|nr:hypothetical protein [Solirubrobacterales bacterium]
MGRRGWLLYVLGLVVALAAVIAVVSLVRQSGPKTLSETATKDLLRELPYRFEFRSTPIPDGADGAVAGVARGAHGTVVRFGVSLGQGGKPISLGPHSDLAEVGGGETFRVTNDSSVIVDGNVETSPRIKSSAQWHDAVSIVVAIEEKLCRATEGKACAI